MKFKSILGLPILLIAASCVPPLASRPSAVGPVSARPAGAAPTSPAPLPPPEAIAPGRAAEPFVVGRRGAADIAASLRCLTDAVYHEARSEGLEGQRAVAQVVLNRVRHSAFPKSVCAVVYQGSRRSTGCQFSFTCDGSLGGKREREAWARARRVAATALAGGVYGPVGLATHYHTTAIRPWWAASMRPAVTVGSHIFYRWRGEWGDPRSFRRPYLGPEPGPRLAARAPVPEAKSGPSEFGVTVHRGAPPALAAAESAGVRIHRASDAAEVRVHVGTPDGLAAAAAELEAPALPAG